MRKTAVIIEALAVTAIALLLYLPNLSKHYDLDGVAEARALDVGVLFTPNHLSYRPAAYVVIRLINALGYTVRSLTILQIVSALFGAMTIGAAYVMFYVMGRHRPIAAAASLWLATTPAFWMASTDAGYVTVSAFFVALSVLCVIASRTYKALALSGVFASLAILSWE